MHPFLPTALTLLITAAAQAQTILRARLTEADTLRYALKAELSLARNDEPPERLTQQATIRFTVVDVDRDGNATVRAAFESLRATRHADGAETTYQSGPEASDPGASPLAAVYAALSNSILEFDIRADGLITDLAGLDELAGAAREAKVERPERLLGVLSPESIAPTIGPIFALDTSGLPRQPGQSWTTARPISLPEPYTAKIETTYTLTADGNALEAKGPIAIILHKPDRTGHLPVIEIPEQSGSAAARWNPAASRLISHTAEQRAVWTFTLPVDNPMTTRRTSTSRIELTKLD